MQSYHQQAFPIISHLTHALAETHTCARTPCCVITDKYFPFTWRWSKITVLWSSTALLTLHLRVQMHTCERSHASSLPLLSLLQSDSSLFTFLFLLTRFIFLSLCLTFAQLCIIPLLLGPTSFLLCSHCSFSLSSPPLVISYFSCFAFVSQGEFLSHRDLSSTAPFPLWPPPLLSLILEAFLTIW